jgi:predicted O-methyltransferase YrrM
VRTRAPDRSWSDGVEIREGDALETLAHDLPDKIGLDGAKELDADILHLIEVRLRGALVLADDAHRGPESVNRIRSNGDHYWSVLLAGDLKISMRLL